jgi:hypothetical protein
MGPSIMRHQSKIMLPMDMLPLAAPPAQTVLPKTARKTLAEADTDQVRRRLWQIAGLLKTGRRVAAREACADLLFDFQPLIAADPELVGTMLAALEQCAAAALRRRLLVAVHGEADETTRDLIGTVTTRS